jgi:anti-sigma-K factor RskA
MNVTEYIESGILELYVLGKLSDAENEEVRRMAKQHPEVEAEIIAIEKAIINLSYSLAPYLSIENYERIREQLIEKYDEDGVVAMPRRKSSAATYIGWAAAVVFLFGFMFQYYRYNEAVEEKQQVTTQSYKYEQLLAATQIKNTENEKALAILRDKNTITIKLEGQQAAPDAFAKVYHNTETQRVHVDAAGLPAPPPGYVYQVWALKLDPLTPTSIGLIENPQAGKGIHPVEYFEAAEGFGITLEPAGGSPTPTLEKLYTLGKV